MLHSQWKYKFTRHHQEYLLALDKDTCFLRIEKCEVDDSKDLFVYLKLQGNIQLDISDGSTVLNFLDTGETDLITFKAFKAALLVAKPINENYFIKHLPMMISHRIDPFLDTSVNSG